MSGHIEHGALIATAVWLGLTTLVAATTDYSGIALVIVAIGSLVTAVGGVVVAVMVNRVHQEVKTFNEKSLGQLGAEGETRRAEAIPHDQRTAPEQRHIDESPLPDPPQGPSR